MNKYNQGMTIIEILISVGIIGMVLLFLFNMLVQVRQEDEENNVQSNFIINQSSFIRIISEDIANYGLIGVSSCDNSDFSKVVDSTTLDVENISNYMCIRFEYGKGYIKDRIGYLMVYKYYTNYSKPNEPSDPKWMMKYSRGYYRNCQPNGYSGWQETSRLGKEVPADITFGNGVEIKYTAMESVLNEKVLNAASITMPIIDMAGNHYDIVLSFLFEGVNNFYCQQTTDSSTKYNNKCTCLNGSCSKVTRKGFNYQCDY